MIDARLQVALNGDPMPVAARLVQEDLCLHEKQDDEHVLTAGVMCFPASWTLAEKVGRPLTGVHGPVDEYDENLAKRVQRLFDGVKEKKPMWRANLLRYDDPTLHQPREEGNPRPVGTDQSPYERSERQTLFRLPVSRAVVFAIHTVVAKVTPKTS